MLARLHCSIHKVQSDAVDVSLLMIALSRWVPVPSISGRDAESGEKVEKAGRPGNAGNVIGHFSTAAHHQDMVHVRAMI